MRCNKSQTKDYNIRFIGPNGNVINKWNIELVEKAKLLITKPYCIEIIKDGPTNMRIWWCGWFTTWKISLQLAFLTSLFQIIVNTHFNSYIDIYWMIVINSLTITLFLIHINTNLNLDPLCGSIFKYNKNQLNIVKFCIISTTLKNYF